MNKLIILDLDETLIYATEAELTTQADFTATYYLIYKRPYLDAFIKFCFQHFNVAVWTSSGAIYAQEIIVNIFPNPEQLAFIWTAEKCTPKFNLETYQYDSIKNLKKVKNKGFSLEQVVVVDDSPEKHIHNYGNLIPIQPFVGNMQDNMLERLCKYLLYIKDMVNIRTIEKRNWQEKF